MQIAVRHRCVRGHEFERDGIYKTCPLKHVDRRCKARTYLVGPVSDEDRVVVKVAERLAMGKRLYGPLDIKGDKRTWRKEALEEALDLAVYLAIQLLKGEEEGDGQTSRS